MASQFPTPFKAAYPTEPAGPIYVKLLDVAPEYAAVQNVFKDKGANVSLNTTGTVLRWEFTYNQLSEVWAAVLDVHYVDAQGIFEGFNFRHPRSGTLYTDVHYVSFTADHSKTHNQARTVVIEKRPTG